MPCPGLQVHPTHAVSVQRLMQAFGRGGDCSSLTCALAQAVCLQAGYGLQHFCQNSLQRKHSGVSYFTVPRGEQQDVGRRQCWQRRLLCPSTKPLIKGDSFPDGQRGLQCKQAPVAHTRQLPCTPGTQSAHQTPTARIRHPLCIPGTLRSLFCGITLTNIFAQSHAHQEAERSTVKSK